MLFRSSLELGVEPVGLVHGMQNHDELTYELVHWATVHRDDLYPFRHREITGAQLAEYIWTTLVSRLSSGALENIRVVQSRDLSFDYQG